MIQVKAISGDPDYIQSELALLLQSGWEIIDLNTNLYDSPGGIRKDTTVYLKADI